MKKIFGWIFLVVGILNTLSSFAYIFTGKTYFGPGGLGGKLFMAIGFIGLGYWMIKPKKD